MQPFFDAQRQILKVRGLTWFAIACAAGALMWGYRLYRSFGLAPADGGMLAPLPVRLAWGIGVASLGLIFALGLLFYGTVYIARLALDPSGRTVYISTIRPFGFHTFPVPVEDIRAGTLHLGQMAADGLTVNAPWYAVIVQGRGLALILDLQGRFLDLEAAKKVFKIRLF